MSAQTHLPSSWTGSTLGEVCTHAQYGFTTKAVSKGSLKFLRTTDITSGRIDWDSVPYCREIPDSQDQYLLKDGDVVISRAGSVGFSYLLRNPERAVFASYLIRFRPLINRSYFAYYLKSPFYWGAISENKVGIAVGNVNASKLKEIYLPLPPLLEQGRIVAKIEELFSELDQGIENLKQARAQLAVYRQALLKDAFEGKLTAGWRGDQAGAQGVATIPTGSNCQEQLALESEADTLPALPKGWSYARFGSFIKTIHAGKSFSCDERPPRGNEIGVAKVSAVTWGEYREIESKTCIDPAKINSDYFIKEGDFLLSRANTIDLVGACVIVKRVTQKIMLSDKTLRLTIEGFPPEYFLHYLRSRQGRLEIMTRSTGNQESMRNIGQDRIRAIIVPICSPDEAVKVVELLEFHLQAIGAQETEINLNIQRAEGLRQSILKKAFAGELVPQNPKDEPAAELLKRIRAERAETAPHKLKKISKKSLQFFQSK